MNRSFIVFLALVVINSIAVSADSSNKIEKIILDPQDVPIFYENNPLTGLDTFVVISSFPLKKALSQKIIGQTVEKSLKNIGEVVHLKENDMRGFGAGNVFLLQLGDVKDCDGSVLPFSRLTLSIETPVIIDKSGLKSFPMIWSINGFLKGNVDSLSEVDINKSLFKLVDNFIQSYQHSNKNKHPVFYFYD